MKIRWLLMLFPIRGYLEPDWNARNFPNPTSRDGSCGFEKGLSKWVCDPNNLLSHDEFNEIEEAIKTINLMSDSHCKDKPIQIAVAILEKMTYSGSKEEAAEAFARGLHDIWGVGDKNCQNGILYFISVEDRYQYISRGDGLQTVLSDRIIKSILDTAKPSFRSGLYGKGAVIVLSNLAKALGDRPLYEDILWKFYLFAIVLCLLLDFCTKIGQYRSGPNWLLKTRQTVRPFRLLWLFLISFLLPWVMSEGEIFAALFIYGIQLIFAFVFWKVQHEGDFKRKLAELEAQRKNKKFGSDNCPICLEDITDPNDKNILLCGHNFHHDCIEQWYITSAKDRCPICRKRNDPNEDFGTLLDEKFDVPTNTLRHRTLTPNSERKNTDEKKEFPTSPTHLPSAPVAPNPVAPTAPTHAPNYPENKDNDRFSAEKPAASQQEQESFLGSERPMNQQRDAMHYAELAFRLRRLHYYYPSYITREEVDRWARPSYAGRGFTQDSSYLERLRKRAAESSARSTKGNYGTSFGGGSSGGGAGSGW